MILKTILATGTLLIIAFLLYLVYLGKLSRTGNPPGLINNQLAPCPATPNCVCSEYAEDSEHHINSIDFTGDPGQAMNQLRRSVTSTGGEIFSQQGNYLATTFTSSLFGFVDDVEFRIDTEQSRIEVRSASRVGQGDMNANRNRVERLREAFLGQ